MAKFIITTDSSCDLAIKELKDNNVEVIYFNYSNEKTVIKDTMDENGYKSFYNQIRNGTVFKTSQLNPQEYYDFFKPLLKQNLPIIHVSLGSGLSNTINSLFLAIGMLKEEFPDCDIKPIDSKIASMGLALMIKELISYRDSNMNAEDAYEKTLSHVNNVIAYYTTDTLTYFARGGRLSKTAAFFGNALKINPILDCCPKGTLRIVDKVRGSKKALEQFVKRVKYQVLNPSEQTLYICHADNKEKAIEYGQRLVKEVGFKDYKVYFMGPIIGAHTGPGLVSVFFYGKQRTDNIDMLSENERKAIEKEINKNLK